MIIDCDSCEMRDVACADCVVSVLLAGPPALEIDEEERTALDVLAGSGLVPPLRLLVAEPSPADLDPDAASGWATG